MNYRLLGKSHKFNYVKFNYEVQQSNNYESYNIHVLYGKYYSFSNNYNFLLGKRL